VATSSADYRNSTVAELEGYKGIYEADLAEAELELTAASEHYRSGQTNTKAARKVVEKLVRRKLELIEEIAGFEKLILERGVLVA
jgi:hypothetical protein